MGKERRRWVSQGLGRSRAWPAVAGMAMGVAGLASRTALAQECRAEERGKFFASDPQEGANFGHSLDLDGDVAIIGAFTNDNGIQNGSAYIFRFNGQQWVEEAKLIPSDGRERDDFGISVAIDDDVAVVGAYQKVNEGPGKAYVFRYDGQAWNEEAILIAPDGQPLDYFGWSVAISGDVAAAGAYLDDNENGAQAGAAYLWRFYEEEWLFEARVVASDGGMNDAFGYAVALEDQLLVVGAEGEEFSSGAAYVFRRVGKAWVAEAKLVASDRELFDAFGRHIAISGRAVLIASVGDRPKGSAYLFRNNGHRWIEEDKVVPVDETTGFADTISIDDALVIIGASFDDERARRAGAGYVYRFDGNRWPQVQKIFASDGEEFDNFGSAAAISGSCFLIGARGAEVQGIRQGVTYAERLSSCVNECTGGERIRKAECKYSSRMNSLLVQLHRGSPRDTFDVILNSGLSKVGSLNGNGKAKVRFRRLPDGEGVASATWTCGAASERDFRCIP